MTTYSIYAPTAIQPKTGLPANSLIAVLDERCQNLIDAHREDGNLVNIKGGLADRIISKRNDTEHRAYMALPISVRIA